MALDIDNLTLGELAKVEELSGQSLASFGSEAAPQGLLLAALSYTALRRQNIAAGLPPAPSGLWNDALALTMSEANALLGLDEDDEDQEAADPTQAPHQEPDAPDPAMHVDEPDAQLPPASL